MRQDIFVGFFTGNELAVVKTGAVVQQQFDRRSDDRIAVLVRPVVYLVVDLLHTVDDRLAFLQGKVQRLADIIGKERVVPHVPAELRAAQQVRTEVKTPAFRPVNGSVRRIAQYLSGRDENERVFLKIIFFPTVFQAVGAPDIFQEDHIDTEVFPRMGDRVFHPGSVQHIDQRVAGFDAP